MTPRLKARAFCAVAAAGLAAFAVSAAPAAADFSEAFQEDCSGSNIDGRGATFVEQAHLNALDGWIAGFNTELCDSIGVTYNNNTVGPAGQGQGETGSGAGRRTFGETGGWNTTGVRHTNIRYAGTDDAPTASQEADIEDGVVADPNDTGVLHSIPVTAGAIPVIVNFPNGCTIPAGAQFKPNADGTTRFATDNALWEAAWAGEISTWGDLLPGIGGAGCDTKPIKRVVRQDASGTTLNFKIWLNSQDNPDDNPTNWPSFYGPPNSQNLAWPNNAGGTAVLRSASSGNGPLADVVLANDGSIGYSDLATARSKGFTMTPGGGDDTFWVPLANGSGSLRDPQSNGVGFKSTSGIAQRGADCGRANFNAQPSTLNNWNLVFAINPPQGYAVCALTYVIAWDDYCDVYGTSDAEQARARSTKDYLNYILNAGQAKVKALDYSPLPATVLTTAQTGAAAVGWRKPGGSCS